MTPYSPFSEGGLGETALWGPKRPEILPLGWISVEAGPEGPGIKERFPPEKPTNDLLNLKLAKNRVL